ncbi:MAG: 23S rRNA pseudouridine(955/2504/2580) synthase RluC [Candidatus Marithrix sp.]|nr:23S rRNA pseudouridine(955/2504/2580) synthase RluC [Candidatus Marithrix sp.]
MSNLEYHPITYLDIPAEKAGQRIDNFLHTYLKGVPKSHVYRILRTGQVRVNKKRIKQTYRLIAGDRLRVPPIRLQPLISPILNTSRKQALVNSILHEDNSLLILNKPSGMAVHGGSKINAGVIESLRVLYPNAPYLELVHRLDRDTSGCLMIAKKRSMLRRLHDLLRSGGIHKQYLALVQGLWESHKTEVRLSLRKNVLQSGERLVRVCSDGKLAITQFHIMKQFANASLLQVQLKTGRTHQIRVHAAHEGHPVAGDNKYGNRDFNQQMRKLALKSLFLHAEKLVINLPEIDYHLTINAPLPKNLQQVLKNLD